MAPECKSHYPVEEISIGAYHCHYRGTGAMTASMIR